MCRRSQGRDDFVHYDPDVIADDVEDNEEPWVRNHILPPRGQLSHRQRFEDDKMNERIGSEDEPGKARTNMGIPIPKLPNGFQINSQLHQAIMRAVFRGKPDEKALDHLDTFHRLCSVHRTNDTPVETIKLFLFPFSLAGEAEQWVKTTPSEFLTTWKNVEKEFLNEFFPQHLTRKIRTSIANFRQRKGEYFDDAWKRFSEYQRDCPHHGFKKHSTFAIFYRGCNPHYRELLDSSSGGSFTDLSAKEGELLIRKVVKNSCNNRAQYDYEQKEVFFCGSGNPNDDGSSRMLRDMNREDAEREASGQTRKSRNFDKYGAHTHSDTGERNFRSTAYNAAYPPNYRGEYNEIKGTLRSLMKSLESDAIRLDKEIDGMAYRINSKVDKLGAEQEALLNHVGVLDERLDKESAQKEEKAARARSIEYCQFLDMNEVNQTKDNFRPLSNRHTDGMDLNTLRYNTVLREEPVMRETSAGFRVMMKPNPKIVALPAKRKIVLGEKETEETFLCQCKSPINTPSKVPPDEKKRKIMKDARAKILDAISIMENSEESRPLLKNDSEFKAQYDVLLEMKAKVEEKKLMTRAEKVEDSINSLHVVPVSEPEDLGCFSIPCIINGMPVSKCMIDSGASTSMMPLQLAKLVGITNIKHCKDRLVLADGTRRELEGIAENVTVDFDGTRFLTNFMILDTTTDVSNRIILGRPFILAAQAQIVAEKEARVVSIFGGRRRECKTERRTVKKDRGEREFDNSKDYCFYLGTVGDKTHASKGKSSSFKKCAVEKIWRLKEKGDPGGQFFNFPSSLRVSPVC